MKTNNTNHAKPILKWAGGKTQMLEYLLKKAPTEFSRYIEPFFGGGALFFALKPQNAIISDSNPELINLYVQVRDDVDGVITYLKKHKNDSDYFYGIRALDWQTLPASEAAARTIFLNKTCFNGLYRVNRKGGFNVPFGNYRNPTICDEDNLRLASESFQGVEILCADYYDLLDKQAKAGDFIFLDPPYVPISQYSDFKRYTKEQFNNEDHARLAELFRTLFNRGCKLILTNSNHPLVHELYEGFTQEVVQTKRHISCKSDSRKGEDLVVCAIPSKKPITIREDQLSLYPRTRFMGSKQKIIEPIWDVVSKFDVNTVLDLFSGSGIVSYMLKTKGKQVFTNDYMAMSALFTKAMVENNNVVLPIAEAEELLVAPKKIDDFVSRTFQGLYFSDEENKIIDILRTNISKIECEYKRAIALVALIRACTKKRPRGIFTYTGFRYDDGRKDLKKTLPEQFLEAVEAVNMSICDNGKENRSSNCDAMQLQLEDPVDLVYMDPPYYSPYSDNEYVRRYHFIEGIARDWKGVEIQENTKTKKFKSYPTPFSSREGAYAAFQELFERYKSSVIIVSYSSNSFPTKEEMIDLLKQVKANVDVVPIDYKYSFGNQKASSVNKNVVQEFLFIAY